MRGEGRGGEREVCLLVGLNVKTSMSHWYFTTVFGLFFVVVMVSIHFYVKLFVTILSVLCRWLKAMLLVGFLP